MRHGDNVTEKHDCETVLLCGVNTCSRYLLPTLLVYMHSFAAMLIILQIIHCIEPGIECLIFASVQGGYFILRTSFVTSAATLLRVR